MVGVFGPPHNCANGVIQKEDIWHLDFIVEVEAVHSFVQEVQLVAQRSCRFPPLLAKNAVGKRIWEDAPLDTSTVPQHKFTLSLHKSRVKDRRAAYLRSTGKKFGGPTPVCVPTFTNAR
jgi:hypothetical protein